jgi:hypothetical protein
MRGVLVWGAILAMLGCEAEPATTSEPPMPSSVPPTKLDTTKLDTAKLDTAKPNVAATVANPIADATPTPVLAQPHEELGTLRLGMTLDELKAAVPEMKPDAPPLKGEDEWFIRHMADKQRFHATSTAPGEHGPWRIELITVSGTSKRKTKAGIGVGATKAEVLRAYPTAKYDPYDAGREVALVEVGPDEGLFFILEDGNGRVVSIELGDLRPCAQCE